MNREDIGEKIGIVGETGSGKTTALISIAMAHPNDMFYVIDPENNFKIIWYELGGPEAIPNITLYVVAGYEDIVKYSEEITKKAKLNDWICLESVGRLYVEAQEHYARKVYGTSREEYYIMQAAALKEKEGSVNRPPTFDSFREWSTIRDDFNRIFWGILKKTLSYEKQRSPNFVVTSQTRPIPMKEEVINGQRTGQMVPVHAIDDALSMFINLGVKPDGEKHVWENLWTIIYTDRDRGGKITFQVIKEKGRPSYPKLPKTIINPDIKSLWLAWQDALGMVK